MTSLVDELQIKNFLLLQPLPSHTVRLSRSIGPSVSDDATVGGASAFELAFLDIGAFQIDVF